LFGLLVFGRRRSHAKARAAIGVGQEIVLQSQVDYFAVQLLDLYRVGDADLEGQRYAFCFFGSIMNIEALCAAPPEALAHSPSQMPLSCPVAPGRPKLMPGCGPAGRRALAHADTPNTSPGCRSCASAPSPTGARPRRRAADLAALPKRTSHVAGLQTTPRFAPSHTFKELEPTPQI